MKKEKLREIIFVIEESDEDGYEAKALGHSIFTEGDNLIELKKNIKEAVECHFDEGNIPSLIHLHYVKEEIMSL